jgi:hypothetical protein
VLASQNLEKQFPLVKQWLERARPKLMQLRSGGLDENPRKFGGHIHSYPKPFATEPAMVVNITYKL